MLTSKQVESLQEGLGYAVDFVNATKPVLFVGAVLTLGFFIGGAI